MSLYCEECGKPLGGSAGAGRPVLCAACLRRKGARPAEPPGDSAQPAEQPELLDPATAAAELAARRREGPLAFRARLLQAALVLLLLVVAALVAWPVLQRPGPPPADSTQPPQPPAADGQTKPGPAVTTPGLEAPSREGLAELELIVTLAGEEPELERALATIRKLSELAGKSGDPVRSAAREWIARYEAVADARVRQAAREDAERAQDLADQEQFSAAIGEVRQALGRLPVASSWAQRTGKSRLTGLLEDLAKRKERLLGERRARLEELLAQGASGEAQTLAEQLQRHAEAEFRELGERFGDRAAAVKSDRAAAQYRREETARAAWLEFFAAYDKALAAMKLDQAAALCRPPQDSPLRTGGPARPEEVLAGFAAEVDGVRSLFDSALRAARAQAGRSVNWELVSGRIEGLIKGVEGRQVVLLAGGRAEVKIPVERLACSGLKQALAATPAQDCVPALSTLALARGELPAGDARGHLAEQYGQLGRALPAHWRERFDLVEQQARLKTFAAKLEKLRQTIRGRDPLAVREALAEVRALADSLGQLVGPGEREVLDEAERVAARAKLLRLVFQNGRSPAADYVGIQVDQISRYHANAERTDVDTHRGLKLGASEDLQRLLLRCDGLEAHLGKARIARATLELYQLAGGQAEGAVVGVFRLTKPWVPDTGSWLNADQKRKLAWQKPGASGPQDAASVPDAVLTFDAQTGLWRGWDLTACFRDILAGKATNLGFLLRVVKDEPRYDMRFYPETDLQEQKDPALRPRLVIEAETLGE